MYSSCLHIFKSFKTQVYTPLSIESCGQKTIFYSDLKKGIFARNIVKFPVITKKRFVPSDHKKMTFFRNVDIKRVMTKDFFRNIMLDNTNNSTTLTQNRVFEFKQSFCN